MHALIHVVYPKSRHEGLIRLQKATKMHHRSFEFIQIHAHNLHKGYASLLQHADTCTCTCTRTCTYQVVFLCLLVALTVRVTH